MLCTRTQCALQLVMVVYQMLDAELANYILGNHEGLYKALEPDLSDMLLSCLPDHRTSISSGTDLPYRRLIRKGAAPAFIIAITPYPRQSSQ